MRYWRQYLALAFLAAVSLTMECESAVERWNRVHNADHLASIPVGIDATTGRVADLYPEARESGVQPGDQILSIDGRELKGLADWILATNNRSPGEVLHLRLRHANGREADVALELLGRTGVPAQLVASAHLTILLFHILLPFCCLVLGFALVAARPENPVAWIVLFLFLSVAQSNGIHESQILGWPQGIRPYALVFYSLLAGSLNIWIAVFHLYFPERVRNEAIHKWVWILIVIPLSCMTVLHCWWMVDSATRWPGASALQLLVQWTGAAGGVLNLIFNILFFLLFFVKNQRYYTLEGHHRLGLARFGIQVSFLPAATYLLYGGNLVKQGNIASIMGPLFMGPIFAGLLLFPLVLMYGIAVKEPKPVRPIFRQALLFLLRKSQIAGWLDRYLFERERVAESVLTKLQGSIAAIATPALLLQTVGKDVATATSALKVAILLKEGEWFRVKWFTGYDPDFSESIPANADLIRILQADLGNTSIGVIPTGGPDEERRKHNLGCTAYAPIDHNLELLGVLAIGPRASGEGYSPLEALLLDQVATQMGAALSKMASQS